MKKEASEASCERHVHKADEGILTAFLLNFLFVLIEIAGGLFTNSIAILSDAIHDLGDCAAIGFAYVLERLSRRKADDRYTYGYLRYSLVSALVTAAILVAGSALIWITKQPIIDPILSICVAVYILWHAFVNIKNVMLVLLERAPADFDTAAYRRALEATEGVAGLHHLHVWSLDGEVPVATMHAIVPGELTVSASEAVRQRILETSEHFGVHHATIQLEAGAEPCRDSECHMEDVSEEHGHHHHHHHHH
ncbi:MAG: cation transporter [Oscillospiraceae bacterium]|nr:cation transporter [Oscillospiraceae bacterium]